MKFHLPIIALFTLLASANIQAQVSIVAGDTTVCPDEPTYLLATGTDVYTWNASGGTLDAVAGDSVNFSATTPGLYSITVYGLDTTTLATDSAVADVTVRTAPNLTVGVATMVICSGDTAMLAANSSTPGVTFLWSPDSSLVSDSGATVMAIPTDTTEYIVTATDTTGCTSTASVSVDVLPAPELEIISSASAANNFICLGSSMTLTAQSATAVSYAWSPNATLDNDTAMTVIGTPTSNTTYSVTVTDGNGCMASATVPVQVNPNHPNVTINFITDTICEGDTIQLQGNGAIQYTWAASPYLNTTTGENVIAFPPITTTFTLTGVSNACSTTVSQIIAVRPEPPMSFTQSSGGAAIPLDSADVITINCPTCVGYHWFLPNGEAFSTHNVRGVSPHTPGVHAIKVIGTDQFGCQNMVTVLVEKNNEFNGTPFAVEDIKAGKFNAYYSAQSGAIVIENKEGQTADVRVFSITGAEIYTGNIHASKATNRIDMGHTAPGIYFISIGSSSGASEVFKAVVQ